MRRINIKQFAKIYREENDTRSDEQVTLDTLNYWLICGNADMTEEIGRLTPKARIYLFHVCENYLFGEDVVKMRNLLYNSLK